MLRLQRMLSRAGRLRCSRVRPRADGRYLQAFVDRRWRWGDDESSAPRSSMAMVGNLVDVHRSDSRRYLSTASAASRMSRNFRPMPPSLNCNTSSGPTLHVPSSKGTDVSIRYNSSSSSLAEQISSVLPPTPPFLADATIWGATGLLLTNFHAHLHLPYWACISLTNVCIRSAMLPIAIRGAKTQIKFGNISPEVQYLISNFTNDMKALRARGAWSGEGSFAQRQSQAGQFRVIYSTVSSLRGLFKLNGVNLVDIFKSPMLQIPFFWYFALDLRKVIEGSDPALAQQLVESSFFWITDLTEPDPWYGLPIAAGALLYLNVETAVGKKALSGETSSKSNLAAILKDVFQTLAIFMPCFMAQQPSGVQLYLATSMAFTLLQSQGMRNDAVRGAVGLPPVGAKSKDSGLLLKEYVEKMKEIQAAKAKGGFVLGEGVHQSAAQATTFRTGRKAKSSIVVEKKRVEEFDESQLTKFEVELPAYPLQTGLLVIPDIYKSTPVPFLQGMKEPVFHTPRGMAPTKMEAPLEMPDIPLSAMEAANRGEKPAAPVEMAPRELLAKKKRSKPIDAGKVKSKWKKQKGKRGKR
ncbi:hypothetical protein ACHAXT_008895 [Thalassiosira profunda]